MTMPGCDGAASSSVRLACVNPAAITKKKPATWMEVSSTLTHLSFRRSQMLSAVQSQKEREGDRPVGISTNFLSSPRRPPPSSRDFAPCALRLRRAFNDYALRPCFGQLRRWHLGRQLGWCGLYAYHRPVTVPRQRSTDFTRRAHGIQHNIAAELGKQPAKAY